MRRELLEVLEKERKSNTEFQLEVTKALAAMTARKQEAEKGTQHGLVFEDAVFDFVNQRLKEGSVAVHTGNTTGHIRNSKKGDCVVCLGSESAAPKARFVIEVKEDQSYTLAKALIELREARKNREASGGVFVFLPAHRPGRASGATGTVRG